VLSRKNYPEKNKLKYAVLQNRTAFVFINGVFAYKKDGIMHIDVKAAFNGL